MLNLGLTARRLKVGTPVASIKRIDVRDPCNQQLFKCKTATPRAMCASISMEALPTHSARVKALEANGLKFEKKLNWMRHHLQS